jgi:2-phosphosulfolactate phosphatase
MDVKSFHLLSGAKRATGLTVIIDVFRAFSTACYIFQNGAEMILPVGDIDLAYRLKQNNSEIILVGERGGKIQDGFDYGNSPSVIKQKDFRGKVVVLTTSSGTQGIYHAKRADEIITGSFGNLSAIVKYIKQKNPERVSLVCMGQGGKRRAKEDELCAQAIKNKLQVDSPQLSTLKEDLKKTAGERFFNHQKDWSPEEDFYLCLDIDKFNFVLKVDNEAGDLVLLNKINI